MSSDYNYALGGKDEHTTETEETRSYIIIPASAKARLAHDIITGRSPAENRDVAKN